MRRVLRRNVRGASAPPTTQTPPPPPFDTTKSYGVAGFTAANYFATPSGGGEAGDQTIGWGVAVLCSIVSQAGASATRPLVEKYAEAPAGGWTMSTKTTNASVGATAVNAPSTLVSTVASNIAAASVGKLMLYVVTQGGASGSEIRFFVNNTSVSRVAMLSFVPAPSRPLTLGAGVRSGSPVGADGVVIYEALTFVGLPYLADITAWADLVRQKGDLTPAINRGTKTHYWSVKSELAKGGVAVPDGAPAPSSLADLIGADALGRQGSGLVVRAGNPAWSYGTKDDESPWWKIF